MNKAELVEKVQARLGKDETSRAAAERAIEAVLDSIIEGIKKEKSVLLIGFGTFTKTTRKARTGINPQTKQPIKIKASKTVRFKPGAKLKKAVA